MRKSIQLCAVAVLLAGLAYAGDEIKVKTQLKVVNGEFNLTRDSGSKAFDQTGNSADYRVLTVGTSVALVSVATDVSTNGWAWFKNSTTTAGHYIDIGPSNSAAFSPFVRLQPTEFAMFRLHPTNNIHTQAASNATLLEVWINED